VSRHLASRACSRTLPYPDNAAGKAIAAGIPIGHRSLVYLMHPVKRF
jgi:hypothetical protein